MARKQPRSLRTKTRPAKPQALPQSATPPKPSLFADSVAKLQPLLNGSQLTAVRKSRFDALAKKTKLAREDVAAIVEAHKLATDTGIEPELLFALSKTGVTLDKATLATSDSTAFRKSIASAIKHKIVSPEALLSFEAAQRILARLQIADATLTSLKQTFGLAITESLIRKLENKDIRTLADLREKGGVKGVKGLSIKTDDPSAKLLNAHVSLSVLGADITTVTKLIKRGYSSVLEIGKVPAHTFTSSVKGSIQEKEAQHLHNKSVLYSNYINNVIAESRVRAYSAQKSTGAPEKEPRICGCSKCQDATSPLAYLADLLDYTLDHLKTNRSSVTLTFLQNRFHQPFRDLPFACAQVEKKVRVARICIEILRKHLPAATANTTGGWYLEAAYLKFLEQNNTTYDELRTVARGTDQNAKKELANRMMLPGVQPVDGLFRDPAAPNGDPLEITEPWLMHMFGLRDSTLGPLVPDNDQPLILEWKKRFLRSQWEVEDYSIVRRPLGNYPIIDPDMIGTIDLSNAIPNSVSRNNRPKTGWSALDFLEERAGNLQNILTDLRNVVPGPRSQLRQQLNNLLTQLQDPQLFLVGVTGMEGLTYSALLNMRKRDELGDDISSRLSALKLAYDEFRALVDVLTAARVGDPILNSEWEDFYSVILQRIKQAVLFPQWRQEESATKISFGAISYPLLLNPDNFRERPVLRDGTLTRWRPIRWRSIEAVRRKWEDTLRARIDQEKTLEEAVRNSVDVVEAALLVELRNDLLRTASLPGLLTPSKLKWFTDHYQVDFEGGRCQLTTRVAQAIQTLQGSLWGRHNGLFDDRTLVLDAPEFDEEWPWLGSFAAWRAAIQVWLYPENTLRPTLRRSMTPAFWRLIEALRNSAPVSSTIVQKEIRKFEEYFADVSSLSRSASYESASPFGPQGENVLAISRSGRSRQLYFSMWKRLPGWGLTGSPDQTFWDRIEGVEEAREITGLIPYRSTDGTTHVGIYARTREQAIVRYWFADFDGNQCKGQAISSDLPALVRSARYGQEVLPPSQEFLSSGGRAWLFHRDDSIIAIGSDILMWSGRVEPNNTRRIGLARARSAGLELVSDIFIQGIWELSSLDRPAIFPDGALIVARTTPQRIALLGFVNEQLGVRGETSLVSSSSGSWKVRLNGTRPSTFASANVLGNSGGVRPAKQLIVFEYEGEPGELSAQTYATVIDVVNGSFTLVLSQAIDNQEPFRAEIASDGHGGFFYPIVQDHWRIGTVVNPSGISGGKESLVVIAKHVYAERISYGDPSQGKGWVGELVWDQNALGGPKLKFGDFSVISRGDDSLGWTWRDDQQFTTVKRANGSDAFVITNPTSDDVAVMSISGTGQLQNLWNGTQTSGNGTTGWSHKGGDRVLPVNVYKDGNSQLLFIGRTSGLIGVLSRQPQPDSSLLAQWVGRRIASPGEVGTEGWSPTNISRYAVADIDQDGYDEVIALTVSATGVVELAIIHAVPSVLAGSSSALSFRDGPLGVSLLTLTPDFSEGKRIQIQQIYAANQLRNSQGNIELDASGNPEYILQNLPYLDEAYLFLPLEIGIRYREAGDYASGLDWLRSVYNYDTALAHRKISYRLILEEGTPQFIRLQDWLLDPLNPHAIAETRKGSYSKFTCLTIVRCLLDNADSEFTQANSESIPRARELYLRALDLLASAELIQHSPDCSDLIGSLDIKIGNPEYEWIRHEIEALLKKISSSQELAPLLHEVKTIFSRKKRELFRYGEAVSAIMKARDKNRPDTIKRALTKRKDGYKEAGVLSLSDKDVVRIIEKFGEWKPIDVDESSRRFRDINWEKLRPIPAPAVSFCIPLNPVVEGMRRHAELCLEKIRTCKNIAGLDLEVEPYGVSSAALSASIEFGSGDQLPSVATDSYQPLPYPYSTLIERAKQLVTIAGQFEASMLSVIESADRARYDEIKARQDLGIAQASVRLKDLQVSEAEAGVVSAELQLVKAREQFNHYRTLIRNGLTTNENLSLDAQWSAYVAKQAYATAAIAGKISPKGVISSILEWGGTPKDIFAAQGDAFSALSSPLNTQASYERREQEWNFSAQLANLDITFGAQQIEQARNRVFVIAQERAIANLQVDHAEQILNFLVTKKFANADLYEWMIGVLEQVYRFFLRQATQIAKLAEFQLAFERQEAPRGLIKFDYWEPPPGNAGGNQALPGQQGRDVRGLTGSARLSRDIYEVDQYAFTKNQRKLQLIETVSLASLDPFAFQQFRQTGLLLFRTPMTLFDRKFPGHYLRLMRRVRLSVVALIPPTQGIRATLSTTGTSRVVIGRDTFQTVQVQKRPESIALTAPLNASGLFELDAQPELLVPFEGMGVDTTWSLEMPKASNPFDFTTIADVLITFEFTALQSYDYRREVLDRLDQRFDADRSFSFRSDFADAWYDLNNPDLVDPARQMVVSFETRRTDFPPNLDGGVSIRQLVLYFVQADGTYSPVIVNKFVFTPNGGNQIPPDPVGNTMRATSSNEGVISTRRGQWNLLIGAPVDGIWELSLQNTPSMKNRFTQEQIKDILFVITFTGQFAAWPN